MDRLKMYFLHEMGIFHCHATLPEGNFQGFFSHQINRDRIPQLNIEVEHPKQTPTTTRTKSHAHLSHEKKVPGEICCL